MGICCQFVVGGQTIEHTTEINPRISGGFGIHRTVAYIQGKFLFGFQLLERSLDTLRMGLGLLYIFATNDNVNESLREMFVDDCLDAVAIFGGDDGQLGSIIF